MQSFEKSKLMPKLCDEQNLKFLNEDMIWKKLQWAKLKII